MSKRILIVEDEEDIRQLYTEVLEGEGYEVVQAVDGQAGLMEATAGQYDLVLLDIMLPKTDGLQILKEIKKEPKLAKVKVILLTNLSTDNVIKEGFALGADSYVIKSETTPEQIIDEVRKVFAPKNSTPAPQPTAN